MEQCTPIVESFDKPSLDLLVRESSEVVAEEAGGDRKRSRSPRRTRPTAWLSYVDLKMTDLMFRARVHDNKGEKRIYINLSHVSRGGLQNRNPVVKLFSEDGSDDRNLVRYPLAPSPFKEQVGFGGASGPRSDGYRLSIVLGQQQILFFRNYEEFLKQMITKERMQMFGPKVTETTIAENFTSILKVDPDRDNECVLNIKTCMYAMEGVNRKLTVFHIIDKENGVDKKVSGLEELQPWLDRYNNFRDSECRVVVALEAWAMITKKVGPRVMAEYVIIWPRSLQGQTTLEQAEDINVAVL